MTVKSVAPTELHPLKSTENYKHFAPTELKIIKHSYGKPRKPKYRITNPY